MSPSPNTAKDGATLELGQDLGTLLKADNANSRTNRLAALVSTELAGMRDERRKGWSGQDPTDRDIAP